MSAGRIGVVLPSRENFTQQRSGAVALCARDFARFSRYADRIDILSAGPCDYDDVSHRRLVNWRRWWRRDRDGYAEAVAQAGAGYALLEVQNRPTMALALKRRLPGVGIALHLHNDPQEMEGSRTPAQRGALRDLCDAVYCVSDFVRARFLDGLDGPAPAVVTIWNGAVVPELLPQKAPIVAFTGRIIPAKGVAELMRAFAAADLAGWRLVVAGGDNEGWLGRWRAEALGERFTWLGQVSHGEATALLARAEIAATPSVWAEPFARAAVEAMANGAALIASRRGALPEVCGDAALYCEPEDTRAFAAALRRLAEDAALRGALQAAGRTRAARFEIGAATARLDAVRARVLHLA